MVSPFRLIPIFDISAYRSKCPQSCRKANTAFWLLGVMKSIIRLHSNALRSLRRCTINRVVILAWFLSPGLRGLGLPNQRAYCTCDAAGSKIDFFANPSLAQSRKDLGPCVAKIAMSIALRRDFSCHRTKHA